MIVSTKYYSCIAVVTIIVFLIYLAKNNDKRLEPFVSSSPTVDQNMGLQTTYELISDRSELFKFVNSRFVYLDGFSKKMQRALRRLKRREKEVGDFIKHHKKNVRFLQKMRSSSRLIKPVYTTRDLNAIKFKIKKINKFYQHHLKQYLELYNLNNLLLVQQIYCREKCPSLSKQLVDTIKNYKALKTRFNKELAEILDNT